MESQRNNLMKKHNKVFISWSGGLDSTYLIEKTLKDNPTINVETGYIKIVNNDTKVECELKAIKKMESIFHDKYGHRFNHLGTLLSVDVNRTPAEVCLKQVPIWLFGLFMSSPRQVDSIQLSYVMNDDAVSYLNDIKQVWRSMKHIGYGEHPPIKFPLIKHNKAQIFSELSDEIRRHVWWCETPYKKDADGNFLPCGECVPCQHNPCMQEKAKADKFSLKLDNTEFEINNKSTDYQFGLAAAEPYKFSSSEH